MIWPNNQEYNIAVEHLDRFVLDRRYQSGRPMPSPFGVEVYSGGYSRVYPIKKRHQTIALRCWTTDVGDAKYRYKEISKYLKTLSLPYFVGFDYIDQGILVNGTRYPIIYMEWVPGLTLDAFVDQYIKNKSKLLQAADGFLNMVQELHHHQISHGDLQEGNIMVIVGSSVSLKLIDYDSLYVPALKGKPDQIIGLPAYQHPKRAQAKTASEVVDYFSELVIYLSLLAYAENSSLWKSGTEKQLLFSQNDLKQPSKSRIFQQLKTGHYSQKVKDLTRKLEEFCLKNSIYDLQPLEKVVSSFRAPSPVTPDRKEIRTNVASPSQQRQRITINGPVIGPSPLPSQQRQRITINGPVIGPSPLPPQKPQTITINPPVIPPKKEKQTTKSWLPIFLMLFFAIIIFLAIFVVVSNVS